MIEITAREDGFRRAGMAHTSRTRTYPDDFFTPEQLEQLKAEPMLVVRAVVDEEDQTAILAETPALEEMTVHQLKALLEQLGVTPDPKAKKAELIAQVEAHTAQPQEA